MERDAEQEAAAREKETLRKNLEQKNKLIAELQASSRRESFMQQTQLSDAQTEIERLQFEEKIRLMQIAKLEAELRKNIRGRPYSDDERDNTGGAKGGDDDSDSSDSEDSDDDSEDEDQDGEEEWDPAAEERRKREKRERKA